MEEKATIEIILSIPMINPARAAVISWLRVIHIILVAYPYFESKIFCVFQQIYYFVVLVIE